MLAERSTRCVQEEDWPLALGTHSPAWLSQESRICQASVLRDIEIVLKSAELRRPRGTHTSQFQYIPESLPGLISNHSPVLMTFYKPIFAV
jgi:hypothetical protein